MTLYEHGILDEKSDFRVHVCVKARKIYIFPTKEVRRLIETGKYPIKKVFRKDVLTSEGYAIPIIDILHLQEIKLPSGWLDEADIKFDDPDMVKGEKAERLVIRISEVQEIGKGLWFPLIRRADKNEQHEGWDLLIHLEIKIEVKCDFKGGEGEGCTGNLFFRLSAGYSSEEERKETRNYQIETRNSSGELLTDDLEIDFTQEELDEILS